MGENFNQKLFDNQTPVLTKQETKYSADSVISEESAWPSFSGT